MIDIYHTPPLLMIFCAMSAMTFIVAALGWVVIAGITKDSSDVKSLGFFIWYAQILNLTVIMAFSAFVTVYDSLSGYGDITVIGEVLVLALILCAYIIYGHKTKTSIFKGIWKRIKNSALLVLFCLGAWGVTLAFGWSLGALLYIVTGPNPSQDLGILAPFITGMMWNAPILIFYLYFKKQEKVSSHLENVKLHNVLWPVLLAYLVLILPLFIQHVANSDHWREMQASKPLTKKI